MASDGHLTFEIRKVRLFAHPFHDDFSFETELFLGRAQVLVDPLHRFRRGTHDGFRCHDDKNVLDRLRLRTKFDGDYFWKTPFTISTSTKIGVGTSSSATVDGPEIGTTRLPSLRSPRSVRMRRTRTDAIVMDYTISHSISTDIKKKCSNVIFRFVFNSKTRRICFNKRARAVVVVTVIVSNVTCSQSQFIEDRRYISVSETPTNGPAAVGYQGKYRDSGKRTYP